MPVPGPNPFVARCTQIMTGGPWGRRECVLHLGHDGDHESHLLKWNHQVGATFERRSVEDEWAVPGTGNCGNIKQFRDGPQSCDLALTHTGEHHAQEGTETFHWSYTDGTPWTPEQLAVSEMTAFTDEVRQRADEILDAMHSETPNADAVSAMTGLTHEELDDLGGVPEQPESRSRGLFSLDTDTVIENHEMDVVAADIQVIREHLLTGIEDDDEARIAAVDALLLATANESLHMIAEVLRATEDLDVRLVPAPPEGWKPRSIRQYEEGTNDYQVAPSTTPTCNAAPPSTVNVGVCVLPFAHESNHRNDLGHTWSSIETHTWSEVPPTKDVPSCGYPHPNSRTRFCTSDSGHSGWHSAGSDDGSVRLPRWPDDPTTDEQPTYTPCGAPHPNQNRTCSKPTDHEGWHLSHGGNLVPLSWPDDDAAWCNTVGPPGSGVRCTQPVGHHYDHESLGEASDKIWRWGWAGEGPTQVLPPEAVLQPPEGHYTPEPPREPQPRVLSPEESLLPPEVGVGMGKTGAEKAALLAEETGEDGTEVWPVQCPATWQQLRCQRPQGHLHDHRAAASRWADPHPVMDKTTLKNIPVTPWEEIDEDRGKWVVDPAIEKALDEFIGLGEPDAPSAAPVIPRCHYAFADGMKIHRCKFDDDHAGDHEDADGFTWDSVGKVMARLEYERLQREVSEGRITNLGTPVNTVMTSNGEPIDEIQVHPSTLDDGFYASYVWADPNTETKDESINEPNVDLTPNWASIKVNPELLGDNQRDVYSQVQEDMRKAMVEKSAQDFADALQGNYVSGESPGTRIRLTTAPGKHQREVEADQALLEATTALTAARERFESAQRLHVMVVLEARMVNHTESGKKRCKHTYPDVSVGQCERKWAHKGKHRFGYWKLRTAELRDAWAEFSGSRGKPTAHIQNVTFTNMPATTITGVEIWDSNGPDQAEYEGDDDPGW